MTSQEIAASTFWIHDGERGMKPAGQTCELPEHTIIVFALTEREAWIKYNDYTGTQRGEGASDLMKIISPGKVWVSRTALALFNARFPSSKLSSSRAYWFEFGEDGDLIDTDVPEHADGALSVSLAGDAYEFLTTGDLPAWAVQ